MQKGKKKLEKRKFNGGKKVFVQSQSRKRHYSPQLKKPPLGPTTLRASLNVHLLLHSQRNRFSLEHHTQSDTTF